MALMIRGVKPRWEVPAVRLALGVAVAQELHGAVAADEVVACAAWVGRTLNGMQQGAPQEHFSLRQFRVQQPMISRMDADSDDAPMAQQQSQPRL